MLCRSNSTPSLCSWPANAVMNWESCSSHFQKTHKRSIFITSASKMQGAENKVCWATSILAAPLLCGSSVAYVPSPPSRERQARTFHKQSRAPRRHGTWEGFWGGKQQKFALEKVASWKWGKFLSHWTDVPLLWRTKSKQNAVVERSAILPFLLLLHCPSNLLVFSIPSTLLSAP